MKGAPKNQGSAATGVLDWLRCNESALLALRPARVGAPKPPTTGWNATRAKLLVMACEKVSGNERALSLEQRWGKIFISILLGADDESFHTIAGGICSHLQELALHPHGSRVVLAYIFQAAQHLSSPKGSEAVREKFLKVAVREVLANLELFIKDPHGQGIVQSMLRSCAGFTVSLAATAMPKHGSEHIQALEPQHLELRRAELPGEAGCPANASGCFQEMVDACVLCISKRRSAVCSDRSASFVFAFLIGLLEETADHNNTSKLLHAIFALKSDQSNQGFAEVLHKLLMSEAGSHLVCSILSFCGRHRKQEVVVLLMKKLVEFSMHNAAWLGGGRSVEQGAAGNQCYVSYFLLVGGDSTHRSFKPSKDESQWWGRRDALCRSVAACLWNGETGSPYAHVKECALVFDDRGIITLGSEVVDSVHVPTENNLIKMWRDAGLGCLSIPGLRRRNGIDMQCQCQEPCGCALGKVVNSLLTGYPAECTTVVILHEDYPYELPVFSGRNTDSQSEADQHVVFVMGTVRDMTKSEEDAIVQACKSRGVSVVGCNLGRTAEFTSKIIHALNMHAINNQIAGAVRVLQANSAGHNDALLKKLTPTHRAPDHAGDYATTRPGKKHKTILGNAREDDGVKTTPLLDRHSLSSQRSRHIHFVVCLGMQASEVTCDKAKRDQMYTLSQVCVCALWRSNLGEIMHKGLHGKGHSCMLTLLFSCGTALTADERLVMSLAEEHKAAPSERQILSIIEDVVSGSGTSQQTGVAVAVGGVKTAVKRMLKAYKPEETNLVVLNGVGDGEGVGDAASARRTLSELAYGGFCACSDAIDIASTKKRARALSDSDVGGSAQPLEQDVIVALKVGVGTRADASDLNHNALVDRTFRKVVNKFEQFCPKQRQVVHSQVTPVESFASPQAAVSIIQHFAYHHRLSPSLSSLSHANLSAETSCRISVPDKGLMKERIQARREFAGQARYGSCFLRYIEELS